MNTYLINLLNQLNINFYNTTALEFDKSRHYYWQGWHKILPLLDSFEEIRVADIGCGNGRFGQFLFEKCPQIKISYTGVDTNAKLLNIAKNNLQGKIPALHIKQKDVLESIQKNVDFLGKEKFQLITCFGVFHHVPSFELRLELIKYFLSKLSKDGFIIISFWQFMDYERFQRKVIYDQNQLDKFKIEIAKLEKNDYIINWKRGKEALRYCHFINKDEQNELIKQSKAKLIKHYRADGKEGDVNKYIILSHTS